MIRVGEKRERLRRKTENERKFGKKIAKKMTVNRKDFDKKKSRNL